LCHLVSSSWLATLLVDFHGSAVLSSVRRVGRARCPLAHDSQLAESAILVANEALLDKEVAADLRVSTTEGVNQDCALEHPLELYSSLEAASNDVEDHDLVVAKDEHVLSVELLQAVRVALRKRQRSELVFLVLQAIEAVNNQALLDEHAVKAGYHGRFLRNLLAGGRFKHVILVYQLCEEISVRLIRVSAKRGRCEQGLNHGPPTLFVNLEVVHLTA